MAKDTAKPKKTRWYKLLAQAYKQTAPHDKLLLPLILAATLVPIALSVIIGLATGSVIGIIYSVIFGVLVGILAGMFTLTKRFEKAAYSQMEGVVGGSIAVAQSIRTGWSFDENPAAVDTKGRGVVFRGVGKTGIVLLAEGGPGVAHRLVDTVTKRYAKVLPGVPVRPIYVGTGPDQVPLGKLTREIRKGKTALSKNERAVVSNRLRAMGGANLPVPKGVDPVRVRPDRKALRGK